MSIVTHTRFKPSESALEIYRLMGEKMDKDGFIGFIGCMEITLEGTEMDGGVEGLKQYLAELQKASLVFPLTSPTGWLVRLPLAPV